jgi:hypothetical protein
LGEPWNSPIATVLSTVPRFDRERAWNAVKVVQASSTTGHMAEPSVRTLEVVLTTALKRRAAAPALEPPWDVTVDAEDRTVWVDRDGIAARMSDAVTAERAGRTL